MHYRNKQKKWYVLSCLLLVLLLCSACGNGPGISQSGTNAATPFTNNAPRAPYSQQIYRIPLGDDPHTFDPALDIDFSSAQTTRMIFANLLQIDSDLQLRPYMARSWNQSSDGLQWTFHMQPNLTFSDGMPLTSQDVAYSIDRALQPATNSSYSLTYLDILQHASDLRAGKIKTIIGDSIITPDAATVVFVLIKRAIYFPFVMATPATSIIEKKMINKYGNVNFTNHLTEGGGSGPFRLAQYIPHQEIDFVPNPYYYDLKPQLQKVVFLTDTSHDYYSDYQNGTVESTGASLSDATGHPNEYHEGALLQIEYIAMNFLAKPFDNLHIRQAFALAINRDTLNHDAYYDAEIPTYHIILQGMQGYNLDLVGPAGIKDTHGNVAKARQLFQQGLKEEGWSSVSQMPQIKLSYPTGYDSFMGSLKSMWQSVLGVIVSPNPMDSTTQLNAIQNAQGNPQGIQMWSSGWIGDYPDGHNYLTIQFGKNAALNDMNYGQNTSADALPEQTVQDQLERADAESDPGTRVLLYQSAEQQLINQVAWIPLMQDTQETLLKPYVMGVRFNPLEMFPPEEWANIYIAAH